MSLTSLTSSIPRIAHRLRALIVATVLASAVAACFEWTSGPPPAPTPVTTVVADRARIVLKDGRAYDVKNLTVTGDSLFGSNIATRGERVAVAVRDVGTIQARRFTAKRGWIAAGIVLLILIATGALTVEEA